VRTAGGRPARPASAACFITAALAASDVVVFFVDWLVQGGVPNGAGFSINERLSTVSIRFSL